jgi:hypothetical protein
MYLANATIATDIYQLGYTIIVCFLHRIFSKYAIIFFIYR